MPETGSVLDIGCGNGRNSRHMSKLGYEVESLDMAPPDFGVKVILGRGALPNPKKSYDVILANYVLMFLNQKERLRVMSQMHRASKPGTILVMEMYPAKDAHPYNFENMVTYYLDKGWEKLRKSKDKCVLRRE
jgi:tellurite methyltransferase